MSILPTLPRQAWRVGKLQRQPRAWSQRSLPSQACRGDLPSKAHLCQPVDHQHGQQAQLQVLLGRLPKSRVAICS